MIMVQVTKKTWSANTAKLHWQHWKPFHYSSQTLSCLCNRLRQQSWRQYRLTVSGPTFKDANQTKRLRETDISCEEKYQYRLCHWVRDGRDQGQSSVGVFPRHSADQRHRCKESKHLTSQQRILSYPNTGINHEHSSINVQILKTFKNSGMFCSRL